MKKESTIFMAKTFKVYGKEIVLDNDFVSSFEEKMFKMSNLFYEYCLFREFGDKIMAPYQETISQYSDEQLVNAIKRQAECAASEIIEEAKSLSVKVAGFHFEIPDKLITDMKKYMFFSSTEEIIIFMKLTGIAVCDSTDKNITEEEMQSEFIQYYEDTLETYIV